MSYFGAGSLIIEAGIASFSVIAPPHIQGRHVFSKCLAYGLSSFFGDRCPLRGTVDGCGRSATLLGPHGCVVGRAQRYSPRSSRRDAPRDAPPSSLAKVFWWRRRWRCLWNCSPVLKPSFLKTAGVRAVVAEGIAERIGRLGLKGQLGLTGHLSDNPVMRRRWTCRVRNS